MKKILITTILLCCSLSFAFCQEGDNKETAVALVLNSVSDVFTTEDGTPDGVKPSCWKDGPSANKWFKFIAQSSNIDIQLNRGSIQRAMIALWDDQGNVISCNSYASNYSNVSVGSTDLTPGNTYYISVDNQNYVPYRGTFTLAVYNRISNDFKEGALTVNSSGCTEEFDNVGGTPDGPSSCSTTPYANKWYKFVATSSNIDIKLNRGTITAPRLMLWDSNLNLLSCEASASNSSDVRVGSVSLTSGEVYFISVDNLGNSSWRGTFTLCLSNEITNDFKEGAKPINSSGCTEEFSTVESTPDGPESCTVPFANRWYSFTPRTSKIDIELKRGTITDPRLMLWDSDFQLVACAIAENQNSNVSIKSEELTPGNKYYISVDNRNNNSWKGTFSLCLDDYGPNICAPLSCNEKSVMINVSDARGYDLAVGGKIIAEEVTILSVNNWPDYVFGDNYELSSLKDLETYITMNKHLPEIPSIKEVDENGVELGNMNKLLLKKIEELTLYLIQQNKEIQELKKEVSALKKD
ncbi:hypothetical protein [Flammeovirga sp. SJP92]|uniref:hypothetical protein n=1 Tax=Flammeovirga sp. SJP92 TaxID=1775430 RepID=UPI000786F4A0|nr:hypothetical protein [Flammeovirga sp. SJP92]KXX67794.1 hypothetical protein AVL50_25365 [Flammeovirga sp. SJP92]